MKLIGPQKNQVQSLGRHQSGLTAEAGKAQAIQTATQGVSNALQTVAGAAEDILATNTQRQKQQSELFMQKSDNDFWAQWGGKDFFDVSELPEEVITDGMRTKGRIASAEVLPQMYKSFIDEELPKSSMIIENESMRNDWLATSRETALGRQQSIQTQANSQIERQIFIDQNINYNNEMDIDRPDVALRIAQEMKGKPEIVEGLKDDARKASETIRYKRAINDQNREMIDGSIKFLKQSSDAYKKGIGQLNIDERLAWQGKLQNTLDQMDAKSGAFKESEKRMLVREIRITSENALNGNNSSIEDDLDLLNRVRVHNLRYDNELNDKEAELLVKIKFDGFNDSMLTLPRDKRNDFADNIQVASMEQFEIDQLRGRLTKSNESQTSLENSDFMEAFRKAGNELTPINFGSNPNELSAQLGKRFDQFRIAQGQYGDGLGEGIFTKDEAESFSAILNEMGSEDKIGILFAIGNEFQQDSANVFEQLGTDGTAKSFAVAGVISSEGMGAMAVHILNGDDYRKDPQQNLRELDYAMDEELFKSIGNAYGYNNYGASVQEAIKSAYISMARPTTDLTEIDNGGWFSEDLYAKAVEGVTGGIFEYNGRKIATPKRGMTQKNFDKWIDTISTEYIDQLGGVKNGTSLELSDAFRNNEVHLEPVGQGQFVIRQKNGEPLRKKDDSYFILIYDDTVAPRDIEAERREVDRRGRLKKVGE